MISVGAERSKQELEAELQLGIKDAVIILQPLHCWELLQLGRYFQIE